MENPLRKIENKERPGRLIGKITAMRHGDTEYHEDGSKDITDTGAAQMQKNAETIKNHNRILETDTIIPFATPSQRSQDSVDELFTSLGKTTPHKSIMRDLRPIETTDPDEAFKLHKEHKSNTGVRSEDMGNWEMAFTHLPQFADPDGAFEARQDVAHRAVAVLAQTIKAFQNSATNIETLEHIPHMVGAGHFEVFNEFLIEIFGIDSTAEGKKLISYGEMFFIDVHESAVPDAVLLTVTYRDETKQVLFNIENQSIKTYA